jgi:hypothetical protein
MTFDRNIAIDVVRFWCYLSPDGRDEIRTWFDGQTEDVRGRFTETLDRLASRHPVWWRRKPYGVLRSGACAGLGEIRIEYPKGTHYRILGYFAATGLDFVMVYPFPKDIDPAYRRACRIARFRRMEIEHGQRRTGLWHRQPTGWCH